MAWHFALTDLSGAPIGEIQAAFERRLTLSLNGLSSASFTIRQDNPMANEITTRNGDVLLKVYQTSTLRFVGDLVSAEEASQDERGITLACNFAGPLWRLQKRLCAKSSTDVTFTGQTRADLMFSLLTTTNTERDTGIRVGSADVTPLVTAGPWNYKPVAEALTELAASPAVPFESSTAASTFAQDNFDSYTSSAPLTGLTAPDTNVWAGAGGTKDFHVTGDGRAARDAASPADVDTSYDAGRFCTLGPSKTAVDAQVDYYTDTAIVNARKQGLLLRFSGVGTDWAVAFVDYSVSPPSLGFTVRSTGPLATASLGGAWATMYRYTIRCTIDALGNYSIWHYDSLGSPGSPTLSGQSNALKTGGSAAAGTCGIYNANPTAYGVHIYENFKATTPAAATGGTVNSQDTFDTHAVGNLTGKTASDAVSVWAGGGGSRDFTTGTAVAVRSASVSSPDADTSYDAGRFNRLGASLTNTLVQVDYTSDDGSARPRKSGILARFQGVSTNWAVATIDYSVSPPALAFVCRSTGPLGTVSLGTWTVGVWYTLRLVIDDSGGWAVWHYDRGTTPDAPYLTGQHDALKTGGALDAGTPGIYEANPSQFGTVQFDNFWSSTPTLPVVAQGIDFEFVPLDIGVGGETKIAAFNIATQVGTAKPEAIFEYGGGNRSSTNFKRAINKEGLLNQAISLPSTDAVSANDPTTIASRGLFEEVIPNDLGSTLLRKALMDAYIGVRKEPRVIFTFEPSVNAPVFGTDYIVGDTVTARVRTGATSGYAGLVRVYGVEVAIDDNGKETITPTLVPE